MDFRIADTFTDSLAKLTGDEQKAVKTSAFDLQLNPANPGMKFHRLDTAKDRNFWSVRVNADLRMMMCTLWMVSLGGCMLFTAANQNQPRLKKSVTSWAKPQPGSKATGSACIFSKPSGGRLSMPGN